MADTNNRQFSVMVDDSGVLNYPQNFITANSLASFGSDVVGTFKQIKLGNENTGASTIILNSTEDENLGYNTDLIISNKNLSGYTNRIILNFSENNNDPIVGPGLNMEYNTVLGTADIRLSTSSSNHYSGSIYLNSYNTSITCINKFTVSADYVSLNSPEGNFSVNMPEGNTLIKTGGLTSILAQKESGAVEIGVGHSYFDMPAPGTLSNNIIIDKDKIAVSAPLVELPANTTIGGAAPATFGNNVVGTLKQLTIESQAEGSKEGIIIGNHICGAKIKGCNTGIIIDSISSSGITVSGFTGSGIKINTGFLGVEGDAAISINNYEGPIISVDGEDYLAQFAKKTEVVDLTSEQTITGHKTFTGNMIDFGNWTDDMSVHFNNAKIIANGGIDADNQLRISSGNGGPIFGGGVNEKVSFEIPQYLRVFDTVTKKWTDTYKYTYLAQDANGNVTLVISDTNPSD
jgi:hypothetical protein